MNAASRAKPHRFLSALAGQLALSLKGNVLSAAALIGPGELDPSGTLSSRSHWLKQTSVKGEEARGDIHPPEHNPAGFFFFFFTEILDLPQKKSCDWLFRPEG